VEAEGGFRAFPRQTAWPVLSIEQTEAADWLEKVTNLEACIG
jgi:hypothetical protein